MSELSKNLSQLDPETIEVVPTPQSREQSLEELMAHGAESPLGPQIVNSSGHCGLSCVPSCYETCLGCCAGGGGGGGGGCGCTS